MKVAALLTLITLSAVIAAKADFSYISTRKATGGAMAAMAGGNNQPPARYYYKGQKMKLESGDTVSIFDFDAQTITTIDNAQKTISVRSFNDAGGATKQGAVAVKVDVKETGQKKTINGYSANELIMTMELDSPETRQMGKVQMETEMWLSPDVPGAGELRSFYQKNMAKFPWTALTNGNAAIQSGLAELLRKTAEMNGVQVLQVVRIKSASALGGPATPQMSAAQNDQMKAAMAKLQEMQKQGGPAGAAAAQALSRMGAATAGGSAGGAAALLEMTTESSDFSIAAIPDSVFAIPAGYRKIDPK